MSNLNNLGIETPCDIQAEQSVLGAILISTDALAIANEHLQGGEFHDTAHARIFRAMKNIVEDGKPLDIVSLSAYLTDSEEMETVGGVSYLAKLAGSVPSASSIGYYAERVKEMFLRKEAIEVAISLLKEAAQEQDVNAFVAMAETAVSKLSDQSVKKQEFTSMKDILLDVWDETERLYNTRETNKGVTGLPSGYKDLDRMTAGFQKNDLIIVAARPSVGKTAFALNVAQNVGIRANETVAVFSLEMSKSQLTKRMISAEANIDASKMRTGFFEIEDWDKMTGAVSGLSDSNIFIDDTPGITVNEIRSKCRRLKKEKGLGMVLIDYIQLIQGNSKRGENRQQEVSEISRTLKQIARELEVPVIALSQLSRGVEQRQDKRPMMSDLRESGSIEQDADIVAFLYRDDYYDKESEKKNIIEIIIAKQRNGPVGTVELVFLKHFNKFVSLERNHQSQSEPLEIKEIKKVGKPIPDQYRG